MEEAKADLIHLHWIWPMGLGVKRYCRESGIPYVLTCHGSDIYSDMKDMRKRPYILEDVYKRQEAGQTGGTMEAGFFRKERPADA